MWWITYIQILTALTIHSDLSDTAISYSLLDDTLISHITYSQLPYRNRNRATNRQKSKCLWIFTMDFSGGLWYNASHNQITFIMKEGHYETPAHRQVSYG